MSKDRISLHEEFADLNAAFNNGAYAFLAEDVPEPLAVLMASGFIDRALVLLILLRCPAGRVTKTKFAEMFRGYGPLSTFSSRIALCHMMGFVTSEINKDLQIIKTIRNAYAHSLVPLELQSFPQCFSLTIRSSAVEYKRKSASSHFFGSCVGTLEAIATLSKVVHAERRIIHKYLDEMHELLRTELNVKDPLQAQRG